MAGIVVEPSTFAAERASEEQREHGVHEGVARRDADPCVVKQIRVRGERHQRADDEEVGPRQHRRAARPWPARSRRADRRARARRRHPRPSAPRRRRADPRRGGASRAPSRGPQPTAPGRGGTLAQANVPRKAVEVQHQHAGQAEGDAQELAPLGALTHRRSASPRRSRASPRTRRPPCPRSPSAGRSRRSRCRWRRRGSRAAPTARRSGGSQRPPPPTDEPEQDQPGADEACPGGAHGRQLLHHPVQGQVGRAPDQVDGRERQRHEGARGSGACERGSAGSEGARPVGRVPHQHS
jgi:hypothetical protein